MDTEQTVKDAQFARSPSEDIAGQLRRLGSAKINWPKIRPEWARSAALKGADEIQRLTSFEEASKEAGEIIIELKQEIERLSKQVPVVGWQGGWEHAREAAAKIADDPYAQKAARIRALPVWYPAEEANEET